MDIYRNLHPKVRKKMYSFQQTCNTYKNWAVTNSKSKSWQMPEHWHQIDPFPIKIKLEMNNQINKQIQYFGY